MEERGEGLQTANKPDLPPDRGGSCGRRGGDMGLKHGAWERDEKGRRPSANGEVQWGGGQTSGLGG